MNDMQPEQRSSGSRFGFTKLVDEVLVAAICAVVFWCPVFIGGDYSRTTAWTGDRTIALVVLAATAVIGIVLVRGRSIQRVSLAPLVVTVSAVVLAASAYIAASWVEMPPTAALLASTIIAVSSFVIRRNQGQVAVLASAVSAALLTFWMAVAHC